MDYTNEISVWKARVLVSAFLPWILKFQAVLQFLSLWRLHKKVSSVRLQAVVVVVEAPRTSCCMMTLLKPAQSY